MFKLIELWDNVAFILYDFFALLKYFLIDRVKCRKFLKKNKQLKDRHKNERCFIVLNGPSIKKYDLRKLEKEITICSNYFYLSGYMDVVKPNYYCICDSNTFKKEQMPRVRDILNYRENMEYIFNYKALDELSDEEKEKCYFVYGKHMPHLGKVRNNLSEISSSFINVSMFCIICAIYMGFSNIYILGNDFAPGAGLTHCYGKLIEEIEVNKVYQKRNRVELCTFYWCYFLAHLQSFYVNKFAKKSGVNIYNVNEESYVRAYEFKAYEDIF